MTWEKFISSGIRMPFYMHMYVEGKRDDMSRCIGLASGQWISISDQQLTSIYYDLKHDKEIKDFLSAKFSKPDFLVELPKIIVEADKKLLLYCRSLRYRDYDGAKKDELAGLLKKFAFLFKTKFGLYSLPKLFSDATTILMPKFIINTPSEEDMAKLIEPPLTSPYVKARITLLTIAAEIIDKDLRNLFESTNEKVIEHLGRFYPELYYSIEKYVRDFDWVPVNHHVQPLNLDLALEETRQTLSDTGVLAELNELRIKPVAIAAARKRLIKKYTFSKSELAVINFLRDLNIVNETRKAAMSQSVLWSYPLFQAIADYLKVDVISLRQLTYHEMLAALKKGKIGDSLRKTMKERLNYYFCLLRDGKITHGSGEKAKIFVERLLNLKTDAVNELKGQIAHPGKVVGKVRLILMEYQVQNLLEGEILVSSMTDPDMVPAMKKAAAIVTNEGGITCHAAIVARELKKPCVIGTKIATKVFKDGDLVEVDAYKGIVRKV